VVPNFRGVLATGQELPLKRQELEEHIVLNEQEKKKIENVVGAFIARRRPPVHVRKEVDLDFRIAGQSIEIFEIRPVWQGNGETHEIPIAKAIFVRTRGVWQLYWQRRDLKWRSYEPLPAVRSIEEVIAEIDADPCACFWG
jgi:hypothetical protein